MSIVYTGKWICMKKSENHFTAKIVRQHAGSRIVQMDSKYRPEENAAEERRWVE
jgi:hypothetical protein